MTPLLTFCILCRYFGERDGCNHPSISFDVIGNNQPLHVNVIDARSRTGLCGPEARFFERIPLTEPGLPERT